MAAKKTRSKIIKCDVCGHIWNWKDIKTLTCPLCGGKAGVVWSKPRGIK